MRIKFWSGIFLAIIGGFLFAKTLIIFLDLSKNVTQIAYRKVEEILPNLENVKNLALSKSANLLKQEKELGGSSEDDNKFIEDFPNNEEFVLSQGSISEDLTIPQKGKVIVANLETMKLDLYEDDKIIQSFDILSKGRSGTPWETPPGSFKILYKKENHFSNIGKVWMPYSMQFFGNYFIHGWPYYPDGTPVSEGYSGGCIRLANDDIEKVYKFGDIGTKIIILGQAKNSTANEKGKYEFRNNSVKNLPKLTATSYLVADLETGQIITSKNEKIVHPIASLSKMMTALVSLETINQYKETEVSKNAYKTYGEQGSLVAGEKIFISDLLYPLLLESSNDAAEVLAEFAGRKDFIKNMNEKSKSIGLLNTEFEDPSGLSPDNVSTAEDLFKLVRYIFKYKSYIFEVTKLKEYENEKHVWYSNSKFKNEKYFIGGKNGYTDEAHHTLVTLVDLPLAENKTRKIAIIILDAEKTEKDTRAIISYLLRNVYYVD